MKPALSILVAAMSCVFLLPDAQAQYGPEMPLPGIHRRPGDSSQDNSQPSPKDHASSKDNFEAEGRVQSMDAKALLVATNDGRLLNFKLTDATQFVRSEKAITANAIHQRATVHVVANEDGESYLTARRVELLKDPAAPPTPGVSSPGAPQTAAATEEVHPEVLGTPVDAPGRPVLRRGGPSGEHEGSVPGAGIGAAKNRTTAENRGSGDDDSGIIIEAPAKEDAAPGSKPGSASSQELVHKAKDWVGSFSGGLPNYVCQQITTRYQEESKSAGWQALDVVTAQVVYEDGKEQYRNITVGGRKTNKSMLELGGDTSTGEFGSTLRSLFSDGSQAQFKYFRSSNWSRGNAVIYDFKVALHNSDWQIRVGGQTLVPAYSGSVWIDKATAQVRRIEMQADKIPTDFPLDTVQWAVDYDMVPLGTASFLLPIRAENLGCQRGTSTCMKNTIEFRNYQKFAGQSTITYDK
jgi:hypothetical protein